MKTADVCRQLLPFSLGATLSLFVVALVVQPAMASVNPQCDACQAYWYDKSIKGNNPACAMYYPANTQQKGYQLQACAWKAVHDNCFKPVAGQTWTEPCWGDPGPPHYTDCGSEVCSFISCAEYNGSICTGFCYNCDAVGTNCNQLQQVNESRFSACLSYCGCGNP